ncbi:MAG: methyltransferase domain-containing protein [Terriglobales bacterium]
MKFGDERTQVVRDLVQRVTARLDPARVRRIVDLGCGPGNSTAVLARQWPHAELTGLDFSEEMLAAARARYPEISFSAADIVAWAVGEAAAFDLVFSNSALHWVPAHVNLLPRLFARVAPGGALAFQVPANWASASCQLPRQLAATPDWQEYFLPGRISDWDSAELSVYYGTLAPLAAGVELWETEYVQVVESAESILAWYQGSGLRPFLAALPDEPARRRFSDQYLEGLRRAYPPAADGRVLFPFRRRFVIASQAG